MPIKNSSFKSQMMKIREMIINNSKKSASEKDSPDNNMKTMHTSREIKNTPKDPISNSKSSKIIFNTLTNSKQSSKRNSQNQSNNSTCSILLNYSMMSISYYSPRRKKEKSIQYWQMKRINSINIKWRSIYTKFNIRRKTRMKNSSENRKKNKNFTNKKKYKPNYQTFLNKNSMITKILSFNNNIFKSKNTRNYSNKKTNYQMKNSISITIKIYYTCTSKNYQRKTRKNRPGT